VCSSDLLPAGAWQDARVNLAVTIDNVLSFSDFPGGVEKRGYYSGLKDYSKKNIFSEYQSLDSFLRSWSEADKKQAIIDNTTDILSQNYITTLGKKIEKIDPKQGEAFIQSLNSYQDYKRIVRFKQNSDEKRAISKNKNLIYDEVGDDYAKILAKLKICRSLNSSNSMGTPALKGD
jgi:hypothetical protein